MEQQTVSVTEAAQRLGISTRAVTNRIARKLLRATRDETSGHWRIAERDLPSRPRLPDPFERIWHHTDALRDALGELGDFGRAIYEGAARSGLEAIYSPRHDANEFANACCALLAQAPDLVRICAITGGDYFKYGALNTALLRSTETTFRFLLLNPGTRDAWVRMLAEGGDHTRRLGEAMMFADLSKSIGQIELLASRGLKLEVRFYSCLPFQFLFHTPHCSLFEFYHLGRDDYNAPGCIGGFAPVLRFASTAPCYGYLERGFDHIWSGQSGIPVEASIAAIRATLSELSGRTLGELLAGTPSDPARPLPRRVERRPRPAHHRARGDG